MDAAMAALMLGSCESGTEMAPQASRKAPARGSRFWCPIPTCGEAGNPDVQQCVIRVQWGLCSGRKGSCGVRGCSGKPSHPSCEAGEREQ